MRYLGLGMAALGLAGCGSANTTDFTVDVHGDTSTVKQRLAKIHHTSQSATGIKAVTMAAEGDVLTFTVPADEGYDPAEVKMTFAQKGPMTGIDVAISVPAVPMGINEYLSEDKVENAIEEELRSWAQRYRTAGTGASTETLELTLTTVAVAAQRVDVNSIGFASDFGAADWSDSDGGWADSGSDYAYEASSDAGWGSETEVSYDDGGWGEGN